jgi:hypothetical protein
MNISCYEFSNNRTTKKYTFIEENDIINFHYKIILHWKNDYDVSSYTDMIKMDKKEFTEQLNTNPMINECYNISKKLTMSNEMNELEIKHKKVFHGHTKDFITFTKYKEEIFVHPEKTKKKFNSKNITIFKSNFDYWYIHRNEGQPKLEDIDNITPFD